MLTQIDANWIILNSWWHVLMILMIYLYFSAIADIYRNRDRSNVRETINALFIVQFALITSYPLLHWLTAFIIDDPGFLERKMEIWYLPTYFIKFNIGATILWLFAVLKT